MADQPQTIETSDPSALPKNPLVSVYMLAYRHERFIAQAIEGVIAQQCDFPIELIIGEDCSPDRTREIVLDYQRRYPHLIRVLTSERNLGAHANARRCQLATRGKYIAICEGDDYWHHPRKLQMQVDLMESNPSMTACHTDYDRTTKFRRRRSVHRSNPSPWLAREEPYIALLHEWSVMTATVTFRRDVLMQFEGSIYDNKNWPFGDRNKLLFASLHGSFGYIDESTATFRKRWGSATNSGAQAGLRMQVAALDCIKLFLTHHPVDAATERDVLARLHRIIYVYSFRAGHLATMDEAYNWLSFTESPISPLAHVFRRLAVNARFPISVRTAVRSLIDRYLSAE